MSLHARISATQTALLLASFLSALTSSKAAAQDFHFVYEYTPPSSSIDGTCYTACRRASHASYKLAIQLNQANPQCRHIRCYVNQEYLPENAIAHCTLSCDTNRMARWEIDRNIRISNSALQNTLANYRRFLQRTPHMQHFNCLPIDATCTSNICSNDRRC